jgi:hypothetical protein
VKRLRDALTVYDAVVHASEPAGGEGA